MGVPTSEVGYTSATARRGDHEISYEHVVALGEKKFFVNSNNLISLIYRFLYFILCYMENKDIGWL